MTSPKDLADVNPNAVYTRAQVAALFAVSDETVSNWVKDGKLHQVSPCSGTAFNWSGRSRRTGRRPRSGSGGPRTPPRSV